MGFAKITKANVSYQPYENIKELILKNLTNIVHIYQSLPDTTSSTFRGFPFLVIPASNIEPDFEYLSGRTVSFSNVIEGTIYHDFSKLGDNKLNILKQDLFNAVWTRANQKSLRGYGINELKIVIDKPDGEPVSINNEWVVPVEFSIDYSVELVVE